MSPSITLVAAGGVWILNRPADAADPRAQGAHHAKLESACPSKQRNDDLLRRASILCRSAIIFAVDLIVRQVFVCLLLAEGYSARLIPDSRMLPWFCVGIAPQRQGFSRSRAHDQWDHTVPDWFPLALFALTGVFVMYLLS